MTVHADRRRKIMQAELQGYGARNAGRPVSANPHRDRQRQSEREAWQDGWLRADGEWRAKP